MMNCSHLITFQTPWGRYCWRRMPCGISPALEYFQQKLDKTLEDLNGMYRIALFRQRTKPLLPAPRQLLQPELVTERKNIRVCTTTGMQKISQSLLMVRRCVSNQHPAIDTAGGLKPRLRDKYMHMYGLIQFILRMEGAFEETVDI